ncbi:Wzz/FepE/Etk N-terminal domain-containing protein [Paenibacillus sp. ACRRX]|uniref:YveK family protein n=1 Tax=unclassified Paenibacillus TaxID=185978 RepID=UPI001EF50C71|nr:Wzz/FepE/Etk N-terminal domain-containing protein [Paenibacillus sp. UMB4589-SE434]MCG7409002.1 Wzz/FepE/Etk N-terminal domain-containing protein [Paenibacillus sp. ACRRX]MDK8181999.1 Wzz/FepE/Etk N-terminal domain-containing protein [Paenibacillus sp. UMB4589-SE434]
MELDLKHMIRILWKRKWLISCVLMLGIGFSVYYSYFVLKPVYEASTKFIVNKTQDVEGVGSININDLNANIKLIQTYKELIRTNWILDDVIQNNPDIPYTLDKLVSMIKVSSMNETQVVTITVEDSSYALAAKIANTVTGLFVKKIPQLMKVDNVTLLTAADATVLPAPVKPNKMMNIIVAAMLSLVLGFALAFVIYFFDEGIYSEEDIAEASGLNTLAYIPKMRGKHLKMVGKSVRVNTNQVKGGKETYVTTQQ